LHGRAGNIPHLTLIALFGNQSTAKALGMKIPISGVTLLGGQYEKISNRIYLTSKGNSMENCYRVLNKDELVISGDCIIEDNILDIIKERHLGEKAGGYSGWVFRPVTVTPSIFEGISDSKVSNMLNTACGRILYTNGTCGIPGDCVALANQGNCKYLNSLREPLKWTGTYNVMDANFMKDFPVELFEGATVKITVEEVRK
jgi:hypothetical protein